MYLLSVPLPPLPEVHVEEVDLPAAPDQPRVGAQDGQERLGPALLGAGQDGVGQSEVARGARQVGGGDAVSLVLLAYEYERKVDTFVPLRHTWARSNFEGGGSRFLLQGGG